MTQQSSDIFCDSYELRNFAVTLYASIIRLPASCIFANNVTPVFVVSCGEMRTETAEMSNSKELSTYPCWLCVSSGVETTFSNITTRARHMDLVHAPEYAGEPDADELYDSGYLSSLRSNSSRSPDKDASLLGGQFSKNQYLQMSGMLEGTEDHGRNAPHNNYRLEEVTEELNVSKKINKRLTNELEVSEKKLGKAKIILERIEDERDELKLMVVMVKVQQEEHEKAQRESRDALSAYKKQNHSLQADLDRERSAGKQLQEKTELTETMERQIKTLQNELEIEKNARHEAEKCMHMAKIEAGDMSDEKEELRRKLRMIDQDIQRLTDKNEQEMEERILHAETATRKEFTEKNSALLQDLEEYRKRCDDHEQECEEANRKFDEKISELAEIKRKTAKIEARKQRVIDKLSKDNKTLTSELLEKDDENSDLKERLQQIEAEISERDLKITELSKKNEYLEERLKMLKTKYKNKLKKIKAEQKDTAIMATNDKNNELNEEPTTVSEQRQQMEDNCAELNSRIEEKNEAIRDLQENAIKLEQLTKTNQNLVKELQRKEFIKEEFEESRNKIRVLTEKNYMLERDLQNKEGSELEYSILEKDEAIRDLQQSAIKLEQLTKTNQDLIKELQRNEFLKEELQQSLNEIKILTEKSCMVERDLQKKKGSELDNDSLQKDEARTDIQQSALMLEQLPKSLKEEIQQSQNEIRILTEKNSVLERHLKNKDGSELEIDILEKEEAIRYLQQSAIKLAQLTKTNQDLMNEIQGKESTKEGLRRLQNETKILTEKTSMPERDLKIKEGFELEKNNPVKNEARRDSKLEELIKINQSLVKELQRKEFLNEELLELMNKELQQSQNEIKLLTEKNSQLERDLREKEGLEKAIEKHINELQDIRKRNSMLENKTSGILADLKEKDFLKGQLQESRSELENLVAKNSNLEAELKQRTSFMSDVHGKNADLDELLMRKEELESELEARRVSMENLENEIEQREILLENELQDLRMKVCLLQNQDENLQQKNSDLQYEQSKMETISKDFDSKSKEFNDMQQALARLQSKTKVAENAKKEFEQRCQDLTKELIERKEASDHLESKQKDLKKKLKAKKRLCQELAEEKIETANRLADKEALLHESNVRVLDLEAKQKELYRKIISKAALSSSLEEAQEQLKTARKTEQALQSEKSELKKQLKDLRGIKLEAFNKQEQETESHRNDMKRKLETSQASRKVLEGELEACAVDDNEKDIDKISVLEREIKDWQGMVGDLESLLANSQDTAEENIASLEQMDFEIEAKNIYIAEIDEKQSQLLTEKGNLEQMIKELEDRIEVLESEKEECQKEKQIFENKLKKRKRNSSILKRKENDLRNAYDEIERLAKAKKDLLAKCEDLQNQWNSFGKFQKNVEARSHNNDARYDDGNNPSVTNGYESDFDSSDEDEEKSNKQVAEKQQSQQYKNDVTKRQQQQPQQLKPQILKGKDAEAGEVEEDDDFLFGVDDDEDDVLKTLWTLIGAEQTAAQEPTEKKQATIYSKQPAKTQPPTSASTEYNKWKKEHSIYDFEAEERTHEISEKEETAIETELPNFNEEISTDFCRHITVDEGSFAEDDDDDNTFSAYVPSFHITSRPPSTTSKAFDDFARDLLGSSGKGAESGNKETKAAAKSLGFDEDEDDMLSSFVSKQKDKKSKQGSSITSTQKKMASDFHPHQQKITPPFSSKMTDNFSPHTKINQPDFSRSQTKMATDLGPADDLDIDTLLEEVDIPVDKNKTKKQGGSESNRKNRTAQNSDESRYATSDEGSFTEETKHEFLYIASHEGSFTEETKQSNVDEFRSIASDEGSFIEETKRSTSDESIASDEGSFSEETKRSTADEFHYITSDEGSSSEESKQSTSAFLVHL